MIKENKPNYKGLWAKYKKYEIVKIDNEYYIRPDKKADYEIYDVFDKEKELLVDFLLIYSKHTFLSLLHYLYRKSVTDSKILFHSFHMPVSLLHEDYCLTPRLPQLQTY